jgi:3-deoxy-D-manno-octulosonic-acid transferase
MIHIYRLLTFFYLIFILPIKILLFKETRTYLSLRLKYAKKRHSNTADIQTFVFHASSGEAEYAFPIIRELKNKIPHCKIVMTYFSDSYLDVIEKAPEVDEAIPLPLDLPGPTRSFLKDINPTAIFISRTDLWPEFLTQAKQLKIPLILFSRTQVPVTNFIKKYYYSWLYKHLSLISVVTQEDKNNILKIYPAAHVLVHGDSRWDQVQYKLSLNPAVHYLKPTFVAGSLWPEDFNFLSTAWDKKFGQLIIVPHEKDEVFFKTIKSYFSNKGYILKFLSEWDFKVNFEKLNVDFDVLVIDQFGVLPRLYQNSYASFIGGSFKKKVHSVMESLVSNTPVIVGPFNQNNREAQIFKNVQIEPDSPIKAVNEVHNSQQIRNLIHEIYKNHLETKPQFIDIGGSVSQHFIKDFIDGKFQRPS